MACSCSRHVIAADPEGDWKVVTQRQPSADELCDLRFAWKVVKHVVKRDRVGQGLSDDQSAAR